MLAKPVLRPTQATQRLYFRFRLAHSDDSLGVLVEPEEVGTAEGHQADWLTMNSR